MCNKSHVDLIHCTFSKTSTVLYSTYYVWYTYAYMIGSKLKYEVHTEILLYHNPVKDMHYMHLTTLTVCKGTFYRSW